MNDELRNMLTEAREEARAQLIKEVLALKYEGLSNEEIAWALGLPEATVRPIASEG